MTDDPITHRVKYEGRDDEPFGDHDAFTSAREAFRHYRAVIAEPDSELGSVYITELDDHDEHVIAAHTFLPVHEYREVPDSTCPRLVNAQCSCGWRQAGWCAGWLALRNFERHVTEATS